MPQYKFIHFFVGSTITFWLYFLGWQGNDYIRTLKFLWWAKRPICVAIRSNHQIVIYLKWQLVASILLFSPKKKPHIFLSCTQLIFIRNKFMHVQRCKLCASNIYPWALILAWRTMSNSETKEDPPPLMGAFGWIRRFHKEATCLQLLPLLYIFFCFESEKAKIVLSSITS